MKIKSLIIPTLLFACVSLITLSASAKAGGMFTETFGQDVLYPAAGDGGFPWDSNSGNWRVEGGTFIQDLGSDSAISIPEKIRTVYTVPSQKGGYSAKTTQFALETQLATYGPSGYGGIVFGSRGNSSWTAVAIHPASNEVWVLEKTDGQDVATTKYEAPQAGTCASNACYLRIEVKNNNKNAKIAAYLNGRHVFNYFASGPQKGNLGLYSGGAGGWFDDFTFSWTGDIGD